MGKADPDELAHLLGTPELLIRTGILLLPPLWLGRERELATHLGLGHRDLRAWKLQQIPPGKRFLALDWQGLINDLSAVLAAPDAHGQCILVSDSDLLIAALQYRDRLHYWSFLRNTFKRPRGLLLGFPAEAPHLFPGEESRKWEEIGRLAVWEGVNTHVRHAH